MCEPENLEAKVTQRFLFSSHPEERSKLQCCSISSQTICGGDFEVFFEPGMAMWWGEQKEPHLERAVLHLPGTEPLGPSSKAAVRADPLPPRQEVCWLSERVAATTG